MSMNVLADLKESVCVCLRLPAAYTYIVYTGICYTC